MGDVDVRDVVNPRSSRVIVDGVLLDDKLGQLVPTFELWAIEVIHEHVVK
jgi:hypothetical protein